MIKDASHILLEGIPLDISLKNIRADLMSLEGVEDIHHMHAWSLSEDEPMMTFHALVSSESDSDELLEGMLRLLKEEHGIDHATIQVEVGICQESEEACGLV